MAISLDRATELVLSRIWRLEAETVDCGEAIGRTTAERLNSPLDLPPFDNSAMDGFALRSVDTATATGESPVHLTVLDDARAGAPSDRTLGPGDAARIATGAMMPTGADTVLRVEESQLDGDQLLVTGTLAPGDDVRPRGDDLKAGAVVLDEGSVIGAGEVAMLASIGRTSARFVRRPRVAIIGTGDELVVPGQALEPGQIYDSNMPMLNALVDVAGAESHSAMVRVADTLDATTEAIESAASEADLVVISGGISKGAHDHVKPALAKLGADEIFWQLALRPGHPTWFGTLNGKPVLGLPGNPASSYVVFQLLAVPAIAAMLGRRQPPLDALATYRGPAQRKRAGMVQVVRVALTASGGALTASPTGAHQRSHAVSSLVGVDGLALLDVDSTEVADGDRVHVRLFAG